MSASDPTPLPLLRAAHRRLRLAPLLGALALMVLSVAGTLAESAGLELPVPFLPLLAAIAASAVLIHWLRRERHRTPAAIACQLDERWALRARLETALELETSDSALADQQRADAATRTARRRPPYSGLWYATLSLLASSVVLSLVLLVALRGSGPAHGAPSANAGTPDTTATTSTPDAPTAAKPPAAPPTPPPPRDTSAEIRWIAPESEIKATAIEEVWLKASAETHSGLHNAVIKVSVNGGQPTTIPLGEAQARTLAEPGTHTVEHALYLDELKAAEFDIVSYFITAEPVGAQTDTAARSPMQFIQIRAAREDRTTDKGGKVSEVVELLIRVKVAQLSLLKQNFILSDAAISHTEALWRERNESVAGEQKALVETTTRLRTFAIEKMVPTLIVDNLGQAATSMGQAAESIRAEKNAAAIPPQQRALALLAECERTFKKSASGENSTVTDPFQDKQELDLPPRASTVAGQLEQLAQKQNEVVNGLNQPKPDAGKATERQGEVAFQARQLSERQGLSDKTKATLTRAAQAAEESVRRMAQDDPRAALAPAAEAEGALREASDELVRAGLRAAQAALESERRALNAAARESSSQARSEAVRAIAKRLASEAVAQQETGSEAAARMLAATAERIHAAAASTPGDEKWAAASRQAAQAQAALTPRAEAVRRTLRQLQRGKTGAASESDPAELELAAQLAEVLLGKPAEQAAARDLVAALGAKSAPTPRQQLLTMIGTVEQALTRMQSEGTRDERIRRFDPEEIDPVYRPVVENYFERLSREGSEGHRP